MERYEIVASKSIDRVRIIDADSRTTVLMCGRLLDNMSYAAAAEIVELLVRRDRLRELQRAGAEERNDLPTILENNRLAED